MNSKKILLYGGSFNPIHKGHINAALHAYEFLKCDEIWLIPRKYNYDGSLLLDQKHRVKMINMVIEHIPFIHILDIELNDNNKSLIYSYNSASLIIKKWPKNKYYFLIGADQLNHITNWYNIDKLTKMLQFVCYKRPGYIINQKLAELYNVQIIDGSQIDISSTQVRTGYFDKVDNDIQKYIVDNNLYLAERIINKLPQKRYIHSLSTAKLCEELAIANHVDKNKAYIAGILHDISKGLLDDEIESIIDQYYPSVKRFPKYCHHQYASEFIARNVYSITDQKILKAIRNHARPSESLSSLDLIVYCADKLELSRSFSDSVEYIRKIAYSDIKKAFLLTLENQVNYLTTNGQRIDTNILKWIKKYKEIK